MGSACRPPSLHVGHYLSKLREAWSTPHETSEWFYLSFPSPLGFFKRGSSFFSKSALPLLLPPTYPFVMSFFALIVVSGCFLDLPLEDVIGIGGANRKSP